MITKELGFIYITNGRKFVTKKEAEKYAKQESKVQKAGKKKKECCYKKVQKKQKKEKVRVATLTYSKSLHTYRVQSPCHPCSNVINAKKKKSLKSFIGITQVTK